MCSASVHGTNVNLAPFRDVWKGEIVFIVPSKLRLARPPLQTAVLTLGTGEEDPGGHSFW